MLRVAGTRLTFTAESAKKIILDINELSKRILGLTIEVRSVTIEETVVFFTF